MQQLSWFLENWIFVLEAILVVTTIFAPDRRLPKVAPVWPARSKNRLVDFYNQAQRYSLRQMPMSRLTLAAVLFLFAGLVIDDLGILFYGWIMFGAAVFFGVADVCNRFIKQNLPRPDWKPFSGFLLPAIALLIFGFIWSRENPSWNWPTVLGIVLVLLELALKLKKPLIE